MAWKFICAVGLLTVGFVFGQIFQAQRPESTTVDNKSSLEPNVDTATMAAIMSYKDFVPDSGDPDPSQPVAHEFTAEIDPRQFLQTGVNKSPND